MFYKSIKIIDGKLQFPSEISESAGLSFSNGLDIAKKLERAGYSAYLIGGAVRDVMLTKIPKEVDIVTDAPAEVVKKIFPEAKQIFPPRYSAFEIDGDGWLVEIVRMRKDISSFGRQAKVEFTDDLSQDLRRRDFTINAIAVKPNLSIIDIFGGIEDIHNKKIRTIGDAETRFREDNLRILRAIRFAARLNFTIEENTANAVHKLAYLTKNLSPQWLWREMNSGMSAPHRLKKMMLEYGIWKNIFGKIFKNPAENFDALSQASERNLADAGIFALFFFEQAENFAEAAQKLLDIVEFPKNLRYDFIEVAKILSILPKLDSLTPKNIVKILDSPMLKIALDTAQYIEELFDVASNIERKYPAIDSPKLISGDDLLKLGVDKVEMGNILAKVRIEQYLGKISSREEALKFAKISKDFYL